MFALSVLFFFTNEHNVLMVLLLVCYKKITMQRTQQFSAQFLTEKTQLNAAHA